ncbi:MAG: uridine kinase [Verrucomicrobia bacterium]|nr:uridine kinase [Verrucomicrobiota bacterium]
MRPKLRPKLVALVGGSGAGKTWLAERLHELLGADVARLALDDFYRDRSHLTAAQRARINFDHPRAIDWAVFEKVLRAVNAGRAVRVPGYDFATHTRRARREFWKPKPIVLVEGLWLLRRASIRRLFDVRIFIDCPERVRRQRRLARDVKARGRSAASVRRQWRATVAPMHRKFVAPQVRWADVVIRGPLRDAEVRRLAQELRV